MIRNDTVKHAEAFECGDPTRVEPNRKPKRTRPQTARQFSKASQILRPQHLDRRRTSRVALGENERLHKVATKARAPPTAASLSEIFPLRFHETRFLGKLPMQTLG